MTIMTVITTVQKSEKHLCWCMSITMTKEHHTMLRKDVMKSIFLARHNSWEPACNITHSLLLTSSIVSLAVPPEIVPFSFGADTVNEGEFAQLVCIIRKGDEPLSITWSLKGDIISSSPDLSTTMLGRRTSMLTISAVSHSQVGQYTCRATNPAGSVTHSAHLVVNGNKRL